MSRVRNSAGAVGTWNLMSVKLYVITFSVAEKRTSRSTIPTIFRIWCSMKLCPANVSLTISIPSKVKGLEHCRG